MKSKKTLILKTSAFVAIAGLSVLVGLIILNKSSNAAQFSDSGVETRDGVQFISLKAGLGYSPNRILASASIPTKLEIQTNNTYDCTAFLNIPKLNIKKFLPPTGVTEIEVQGMSPGEEIEGFCGSDTYKFVIRFS